MSVSVDSVWIFCLLANGQILGAAPTPFVTLFRRADTIFVGSIESARRVGDSDSRAKTPPLEPVEFGPVYLCVLTIRIQGLIKSADVVMKAGESVPVLSYQPSPRCQSDYRKEGDTLPTGPALWLLRSEKGNLRTLVDNAVTVRPLNSFSPSVQQRKWHDPNLAVTYLLLKPGIMIPEGEYAKSSEQGLTDIAGTAGYLKVY